MNQSQECVNEHDVVFGYHITAQGMWHHHMQPWYDKTTLDMYFVFNCNNDSSNVLNSFGQLQLIALLDCCNRLLAIDFRRENNKQKIRISKNL